MKVIFMGTPDFAVNALEALIKNGHDVVLVVTQPDKHVGRGKQLKGSPVKETALKYGLTIYQPEKIKEKDSVEFLKGFQADIFIVAAFGQILSKEVLAIPPFGCINIHGSLLPKYRGAAPIQWAVLNGEKETGITIMQMNEGLDTGDMLTKCILPIEQEDTAESLFDKMAQAGADLLIDTLPMIEKGQITPQPQKEEESSYARMIKKEMGRIDFTRPAEELDCFVRGMNSWPGAYTTYQGKTLKIWKAFVQQGECEMAPGTVCEVKKDSIMTATGKGILVIKELQLEGKKRMDTSSFLIGKKVSVGDIFN